MSLDFSSNVPTDASVITPVSTTAPVPPAGDDVMAEIRSVPCKPVAREVARHHHEYRDERGDLLFQAVRVDYDTAPKDMWYERREGDGRWTRKLGDTRRVLYRLPGLVEARDGSTVFVVEGEKKVDRLHALGLIATCNPMGATKWKREYSEFLKGHHVVILPDNDAPGREHAEIVATTSVTYAASIKVVELPDLDEGEDVVDWLGRGNTLDALTELVASAAPYEPPPDDIEFCPPVPAPSRCSYMNRPVPTGETDRAANTVKASIQEANRRDQIERMLSQLRLYREIAPDQWEACCPAHDDDDPSLSISTGRDGRILLHCHAGCSVEEVVKRLGFEVRDLFYAPPPVNKDDVVRAFNTEDSESEAEGLPPPTTPLPKAASVIIGKGFRIRTYSEIPRKAMQWLWNGYLPLGAVCIAAGSGGLGKSFVTCDLAARVTRGNSWPCNGGQAPVGEVVMLNAEDSPESVIGARLDAAGADASKVISLDRPSSPFSLADVDVLDEVLRERPGVRLVVVDPIGAFYGADVDTHKEADVRRLMFPIKEMAERHSVCFLVVAHLNKAGRGTRRAIEQINGSVGIANAARCAMMFMPDRLNSSRRLVLPGKNNYGQDRQGFAYSIVNSGLVDGNGNAIGKVQWEAEPVMRSADEELADAAENETPDHRTQEAADWLKDVLSTKALGAKYVEEQAERAGIAKRTLDRAKRNLGVKSRRFGFGASAKWLWALPDSAGAWHEVEG